MIRGNKLPDGTAFPGVFPGGLTMADVGQLYHATEISINGAAVGGAGGGTPTWAARIESPSSEGYSLLLADSGDSIQVVSVGHPVPVRVKVYTWQGGLAPFVEIADLTIAPGETRSATVTITKSADPPEDFYILKSVPDQPPWDGEF